MCYRQGRCLWAARRWVSEYVVVEGVERNLPASHLFLQGSFKAFHFDHKLFKGEAVGEAIAWKKDELNDHGSHSSTYYYYYRRDSLSSRVEPR